MKTFHRMSFVAVGLALALPLLAKTTAPTKSPRMCRCVRKKTCFNRRFVWRRRTASSLVKQLRASMGDLPARFKALMKNVPKTEWNSPENNAKWSKMYQEMRDSKEYKRNMTEYEKLQKDLVKYVDVGASKRKDPDVPHGYVWLFRRK